MLVFSSVGPANTDIKCYVFSVSNVVSSSKYSNFRIVSAGYSGNSLTDKSFPTVTGT